MKRIHNYNLQEIAKDTIELLNCDMFSSHYLQMDSKEEIYLYTYQPKRYCSFEYLLLNFVDRKEREEYSKNFAKIKNIDAIINNFKTYLF